MKTYNGLYERLCSHENLLEAFRKAKKRKSKKSYVIEFEANLEKELLQLQQELSSQTYQPNPLTVFTVRDPKTRKISASHFRDRVVHHAICNIIGPIFESRFIHDTYANRKGKGTLAALKRFDFFLRKVTRNGVVGGGRKENHMAGYALKVDIKHYFDTVDHQVLLSILCRRISDKDVIGLVKMILENHRTPTPGKGMPLGNLTSQFFANIYLGELDLYVKHVLRVKHYIRYVDDFVILGRDKAELEELKSKIDQFLMEELKIESHPDKSRIIPLRNGITFLGFRVFHSYKLLKKSNLNRIQKRLMKFERKLQIGEIAPEQIRNSFAGWNGYAQIANTYKLRKSIRERVDAMLMRQTLLNNTQQSNLASFF